MTDKLRIGVLGMTHDHVWGNLRDLAASSQAELTAAADINSELLEKVQADFGCPQVFDYYEEMLDEVALDAVYIFGDNATGSELAIRAAERGLHEGAVAGVVRRVGVHHRRRRRVVDADLEGENALG